MLSIKISKTLEIPQKLHNLPPRSALITIYKAFARPYLDYGDILNDQAYNMSNINSNIFNIMTTYP